MNIKKSLLAVTALAALAMAALPAIAAADSVDLPANPAFTVSGGATSLVTPKRTVSCGSSEGHGTFTNSKTGTIELTFKKCTSSGTACTSAGQASETITTTELVFHVIRIPGHGTGILITSNAGHFATFKCGFGLVTVEVIGNGIIGQVTAPAYKVASNTFTVNFNAPGGVQEFQEEEGNVTKFHLEANVNGTKEAACETGEGTGTFAEGGKGTLTEV
jgi:hypothetical protein